MHRRTLLSSLATGCLTATAGCSSLLGSAPYEDDAAWVTPSVSADHMLTATHLVVDHEDALKGVSLETGEFKWERSPALFPMAVADSVGLAYKKSSPDSGLGVVAIDLASGETVWEDSFTTASTDHQAVNQDLFVYLVEDVKNERYTVVVRSFTDASIHSQSDPIRTSGHELSIQPCRNPNYVFIRQHGDREIIRAYDVNTGTIEWSKWFSPEHEPGDSSSNLDDQLVYETESYVAGFGETTGTNEWTIELPDWDERHRDTVFAPTKPADSTGLQAVDLPTGTVRWRSGTGQWGDPNHWRDGVFVAGEYTQSGDFAVTLLHATEGVLRRPYEYSASQIGDENSYLLRTTMSDAVLGLDYRSSSNDVRFFTLPLPDV